MSVCKFTEALKAQNDDDTSLPSSFRCCKLAGPDETIAFDTFFLVVVLVLALFVRVVVSRRLCRSFRCSLGLRPFHVK